MPEYLTASARTAAGKIHWTAVAPYYILHKVRGAALALGAVDVIKKCLFYNRPTLSGTNFDESYNLPARVSHLDMDALHGIIGVATEAGELLQLIERAVVQQEQLVKKEIIDECGDILWYLAMLFRSAGTTFEEVAALNIAKLTVRFPEKFTEALVNTKDHAAEDAVFVGVAA